MIELDIVRRLLRRTTRGVSASSPLAEALLDWAEPHRVWLTGNHGDIALDWADLIACTDLERLCDNAPPHALALTARLAALLALEPFDTALLTLVVACDRLPRVASLAKIAGAHGHDLPSLFGMLAGADEHEADRAVRRSAVLKLGLAGFRANRLGEVEVDVRWTLERLLDRAPAQDDALLDTLVGPRQPAHLALEDFAHVADADFIVRLLHGAATTRACGVNILVHGPPGTGKTELARTLAEAAGLAIHGVGEADDDGEEPTRWDRVNALHLAQRVLVRTTGAVLLFDEMEDLTGDAQPAGGDWYAKRQGSKVFVNRLLETNPVPVVWTTNAIGNVDPATAGGDLKPYCVVAQRAFRGVIAALLAASVPTAAIAAPDDAGIFKALTRQLDAVAQRVPAEDGAPSASIAVVQHRQLVYARAFGLASVTPQRIATVDTRYQLASASKSVTAQTLLLLATDGKVSLDAPVSRWLPELTGGKGITLRELLEHVSGLPDHYPQTYPPAHAPPRPRPIGSSPSGAATRCCSYLAAGSAIRT